MAVYLDNNATTFLDPQVVEAMLPYLTELHGNPSSVHRFGRASRTAVDQAREQVAALVGAHPSQVIFTGGGTEANNLALKGVAAMITPGRLAVSAIEHASLMGPAGALARKGWGLDTIGVAENGCVNGDTVREVLGPSTRLVSVMAANNETGAIQDIAAVSGLAREAGALVHTDAVQAAGKVAVDFAASGAHLMSLSAHKLYGPKGVGALVVDKAVELEPLLHGGGQERGLRGGTENVAGLVGFGAAAMLALEKMKARSQRLQDLRMRMEAGLRRIPGLVIFAEESPRLPNTVQFGLMGIDGETLVLELDRLGFAVSSGSACASGSTEPSHVLVAMGVKRDLARGAVRVSLGKDNTEGDVDAFCEALVTALNRFGLITDQRVLITA